MTYLVFATQSDANTANAQISANTGCSIIGVNAATGLPDPSAQMTIQWAIPFETQSTATTYPSSWVFLKPAVEYMTGVLNYTEATHDSTWLPALTGP